MYRVRLYAGTDAALVAVAEPLVEQRSVAAAATLLWEHHVAPRTRMLEWFDVVDARRVSDARMPLVARLQITMDDAGQSRLRGWRGVSWDEVERCCGGRVAVERLARPLPAHGPQAGQPSITAPALAEVARPGPVVPGASALWWGAGKLREAIQTLAPELAAEPAP